MKTRDYLTIKIPIPVEIEYVVLLFLSSRIVLTIIGVVSRIILEPFHGKEFVWVYSKHLWLNVWGVWDTGWYLNLAEKWYSPVISQIPETLHQANFAFFPLYPLLMRCLGTVIGDTYLAGVILSNFFLILACAYIFKLVKLESDGDTALKSVKYLVLFPTAFILSGVFTESLFLALLLAGFYYAKKGNWFLAGALGFFLSLTRLLGVFAIFPLAYEYFREKKFRPENARPDLLFLLLIPLGLLLFASYNYYLTGDFLAFMHIQTSWGREFVNPLRLLYDGLRSSDIYALFFTYFTLIPLGLLFVFHKKIGFAYWFLGMYSIFIPLSTGLGSMPRYLLAVFPIYILLAKIVKDRPRLDEILTVCLALFQGFLMVFWANGFPLII